MNVQNGTLKKAMLGALEKTLGVVTTACLDVGIGRTTHYEWMKEDEAYKTAVRNLEDLTIDFAESQLHKQIKDGNTTATIFLLKTKGKKRGYVESYEYHNYEEDKPPMTRAEVQARLKELRAKELEK